MIIPISQLSKLRPREVSLPKVTQHVNGKTARIRLGVHAHNDFWEPYHCHPKGLWRTLGPAPTCCSLLRRETGAPVWSSRCQSLHIQ